MAHFLSAWPETKENVDKKLEGRNLFWYHVQFLLLTHSMEQGPSWEASWFAAGQEIPRVLWNPQVPHRTHKRPPPVPILSQPNPVLIP